MRTKILIACFLLCFSMSAFSWEIVYGKIDESDYAHSVIECSTGGYLVVGGACWGPTSRLFALRLNESGEILWSREYGHLACGYDVIETPDSAYLICGKGSMDSTYVAPFGLIMKIRDSGDTIWTKTYGWEYPGTFHKIIKGYEDGYWLLTERAIYKINLMGDSLFAMQLYNLCSFVQTDESSYVTIGQGGFYDTVVVLSFNEDGDTLWRRIYTDTLTNFASEAIVNCLDEGYLLLCFSSDDGKPRFIRINDEGDTLWTRIYGYDSLENVMYDLIVCSSYGYLAAGYSGRAWSDWRPYLIRLGEFGDTLWTKRYGADESYTGPLEDGGAFYSIVETSSHFFVGAGYSRDYSSAEQAYILAVDSLGSLLPDAIHESTKPACGSLKVSPNPFNSSCAISTPKRACIEIFDINGKKIAELADGQRTWTPEKEIGSGIYLVKATTKGGESIVKRIVFMK